MVLPLLVLGDYHWVRRDGGKLPHPAFSCSGGEALSVRGFLFKYGGGVAFLGGWGAMVTAWYLGLSWEEIFWGSNVLPLWGWVLAFIGGALLARLDIRVTRWLLRKGGYLVQNGEESKAQHLEKNETWFSVLAEAIKWAGISFGEEGVRVGTIALLLTFLSGMSFVQSAILVGILIGLLHIFYFNVFIVPTKTILHVILSIIFVNWGVLASFVVHIAFNFSMIFDIEIEI